MTLQADALEAQTVAIGKEIFARIEQRAPWPLSPAWLDERLMRWTMSSEAVKVQLFRFIDVLPMLRTPTAVCRHLYEYFDEARASLPRWLRLALPWLPYHGVPARLLAWLAHQNAQRMARHFIAGVDQGEIIAMLARLRQQSLTFTVDLLGEAVITEGEAEQYQRAVLELLDGLGRAAPQWPANSLLDSEPLGPLPRVNVSLKLSSLFSQFDPLDPDGTSQAVRARLRPILHAARAQKAFVNIDMEQYAYKDLTLRILREVLSEDEFRAWPDVGVAIQAYLHDTERDLQELAGFAAQRGTPLWVRLIKGAYWDYETVHAAQENWPCPVFTHKWQTDANYEKLTRFLLERHQVLRPAFGSHNVRSLAHVLAVAQELQLPPRSFEIQTLYGMADPIKTALVGMGQRVRVYTPYGQLLPGMAYLVRRLLENTANESFLRASFTEHVSEEVLLMNPRQHATSTPVANGQPASFTFRNEPLSDFGRTEVRRSMQVILNFVRPLHQNYPPIIGGLRTETEKLVEVRNPSLTSEVLGQYWQAKASDAEKAISAAKRAFPAWRDTAPQQRADYLQRVAERLRKNRFELAAWEILECGKPWREADADVAEAIDFCEYYAREMLRLAGPHRVAVPGEINDNFYEPRGVVVVIAPWNFPLAILAGMTTAVLVTGNTVIMKPAEQSTIVAAKWMEVLEAAKLPAGVVNFLPGVGEEIGPTLVSHPDVAMIAFTGSRGVGLTINREAAEQRPLQDHVKRVLAEMGGKNAIIIDDDADLDEAVEGVVASAFGYQGQKCSACSRVIVLAALHDVFLQRLVEATRSLTVAPADDPACSIGPVISAEARDRIQKYIDIGKQECKLVYAADVGKLADEGYFIGPHIFAEVAPTATIAQEEIFGPVLAVIKARDLGEALAIANGTQYALTGGLYSRSPHNIERVKREFRVGNLYINRKITGALVWRQPFGGFKMSGIGSKAGGPDYLLQFLLPRTITENTLRRGFAPNAEAERGN